MCASSSSLENVSCPNGDGNAPVSLPVKRSAVGKAKSGAKSVMLKWAQKAVAK